MSKHQKTVKTRRAPPIQGHIHEKKEGWIVAEIRGKPFERGYAHGALLSKELERVMKVFPFIVHEQFRKKVTFSEYLKKCKELINPHINATIYTEFYDELRGISAGAKRKGVSISVDYLIAWNSLLTMYSYYFDHSETATKRCSAFIATGSATKRGDIVMAHDTHSDFATGQLLNIMMYVYPDNGFPFCMQTSAGFIASSSDWFLCSTGIIGCETTISKIDYKPSLYKGSKKIPYFCRIREAMQYGKTLDEYVSIMTKYNAGDYANSWLLGDVNTGEIMLFEIALKTHHIERTYNGVFYGMNSAIDFEMRSKETHDQDFMNPETSSGSRNIRLNALLNDRYYGEITPAIAKRVMSDHYDVFLDKTVMNGRSICCHTELTNKSTGRPDVLHGCTDCKVVDSSMSKQLQCLARFGSACGRSFHIQDYVKTHPDKKPWIAILDDIPTYTWTTIGQKR